MKISKGISISIYLRLLIFTLNGISELQTHMATRTTRTKASHAGAPLLETKRKKEKIPEDEHQELCTLTRDVIIKDKQEQWYAIGAKLEDLKLIDPGIRIESILR